MKDQKIIKLFEKSLNKTVIKISDSSNGIDQLVKIIETKSNKYVMKFPDDEVLLFREIFAWEKLNESYSMDLVRNQLLEMLGD